MSETMTRATLSQVASVQTGLNKTDIALIADRMFALMSEALMAGENVKLTGFGSLQVRARAQRMGRNPRTGSEHTISPRHAVIFTPGAQLREALQRQAIVPAATATELREIA